MHAMWSGSLSFGLVNIPVRLYSATSDGAVDLDLLHKADMSRIRYAKVCKHEEREVPNEEIVKGYEYRKGEYVVLDDEDFEHAYPRTSRTIELLDFVGESEIDSVYYEKPYYLEPDKGAAKAYALLRDALQRAGKVGIARYVLRNREHIAALKPHDRLLILDQMRYESEIKGTEDLDLPEIAQPDEREIDLALTLVDRLSGPFKPETYRDTYKEELMRVIEEKAQGKEPMVREAPPEETKVIDLMSVLKASLEKVEQKAS